LIKLLPFTPSPVAPTATPGDSLLPPPITETDTADATGNESHPDTIACLSHETPHTSTAASTPLCPGAPPTPDGFSIQHDWLTAGDWTLDQDPNVINCSPLYGKGTDHISDKPTARLAGWFVTLFNGVEIEVEIAPDTDLTNGFVPTVTAWIVPCPWDNEDEDNEHELRESLTPDDLRETLAEFGDRDDLVERNEAGESAARAAQQVHGTTPPGWAYIGSVPVDSGVLLVADPVNVLNPWSIGLPYREVAEATMAGGGECLTNTHAVDLAVAFRSFMGDGMYAIYALKQEG